MTATTTTTTPTLHGLEPLIALRKAGIKPQIVFINDFACQTAADWAQPGHAHAQAWPADHATISTAGCPLSSLDLRCVVGLLVSVCSFDEGRAKRLAELCKSAGARTVAAAYAVRISDHHVATGWADIWHRTEGHTHG